MSGSARDHTLQALREQGAHLHDPVRFRYLEALAARLPSQAASVQSLLAARFDAAVAAYRLSQLQAGASATVQAAPATAAARSPLAQLNKHIAQAHQGPAGEALLAGDTGHASDMKSVRRFAEVWSKIATQQQLAQALTRGPAHAGPLNSHNLMLRAMSLMHGLSPDYLRRFLAQADALLWLDQLNQQNALHNKDGKAARRGRATTKKQS